MPDNTEVVEPESLSLDMLIQTNATVNMKKMPPEQRGELIHELSAGMMREARNKDLAWVKLGLMWSFYVKNKLYKYCGDHIKNANDYLKELDIGVKRREMELYAQMAGLFGRTLRERNIEVPIRKLRLISPFCTDDATDVWVDKAISLPYPALEDEVREAKGQPARDSCDHPEDQQEVWIRCGKCNKFLERVKGKG